MSEHHTGISEKVEKFGGMLFRKKHTVRSLKSARNWQKKYEADNYYTRVERERPGFYNVYTRKK
jgi:hypothetical protein